MRIVSESMPVKNTSFKASMISFLTQKLHKVVGNYGIPVIDTLNHQKHEIFAVFRVKTMPHHRFWEKTALGVYFVLRKRKSDHEVLIPKFNIG